MKLFYRFWFWLTRPAGLINWLGDGAKHVSQDEAERRAKICMGCPNMRPNTRGVGVATELVKNRLGLHTPYDSSLSTCRSCGCVLSAKIWVTYEHVKRWQPEVEVRQIEKINPACWQI